MKGQRGILLVMVGVLTFLSGGWLLQRGNARTGGVFGQARIFEDVLAHVAEYAVDSIGERELYDMAIDGLLDQLDDPYANFLRKEDFEDLTERTTGNYGGLGMQIDVRDGWITVIAPIADTPAEAAGIESGDRIVEVEGESTYGWKNEKAVAVLRGEAGSDVRISIARPGIPEPIEFTLTRATIHVTSVRTATMLGPRVGYLSLAYATISQTVTEEVERAVADLRERGAEALVFDLRNTPGGLLDQGVALADVFLDEGDVIVATKGRAPGATETYRARSSQRWPETPIVVLVNGGTASAAEIISGAMQDHDRALVVGTPTFGKGLVQTVFRLGPLQALQLTTGHWYTPSGRTIQRPVRRVDGRLRIVGAVEEEETAHAGDSAAVDSSQVFYTDAGRRVIGGGGIRPDITIRLDTLTEGEQNFSRAIGAKLQAYRDVLTTYALEMKAGGEVTDPEFTVTRSMRNELVRRLRERGIELTDELVQAGRDVLDSQIGLEVSRFVFGRETEAQRRIRDDAQVRKALEVLNGVRTTEELLSLAERENRSDSR